MYDFLTLHLIQPLKNDLSIFLIDVSNGIDLKNLPRRENIKQLNFDFAVMVTISATGEKGKLLVIGKSHRPRGFPKGNLESNFPVNYEAKKKAWMTSGCNKTLKKLVPRKWT